MSCARDIKSRAKMNMIIAAPPLGLISSALGSGGGGDDIFATHWLIKITAVFIWRIRCRKRERERSSSSFKLKDWIMFFYATNVCVWCIHIFYARRRRLLFLCLFSRMGAGCARAKCVCANREQQNSYAPPVVYMTCKITLKLFARALCEFI